MRFLVEVPKPELRGHENHCGVCLSFGGGLRNLSHLRSTKALSSTFLASILTYIPGHPAPSTIAMTKALITEKIAKIALVYRTPDRTGVVPQVNCIIIYLYYTTSTFGNSNVRRLIFSSEMHFSSSSDDSSIITLALSPTINHSTWFHQHI
ncbi:hypothetical protein P691DRAFT_299402 [Macrolepiota fuliginosa MF-IS2]|uniref:Uncharacterized protein n=1 Tax=Macrolepiota fuliginosa MF-IS2 TaxID=1400762 RepID=A0A9P6BZ29_9AGAR|nr:hypothetical protein P691DRAFT_299402 [Macrolepiota fuliginosa MF-IS2]